MKKVLLLLVSLSVLCGHSQDAKGQQPQTLRSEHFDRDPGWDAQNNLVKVEKPNPVIQDFGYSQTNHGGGKAAGEIGGRIQRRPRSRSPRLLPARAFTPPEPPRSRSLSA